MTLTGKLVPWSDWQPVLLQIPGSDLLYLPCFSDEDGLRKTMGRAGAAYKSIKLIQDGGEFLSGVMESEGADQVRVILDARFLPNGRIRYMEVKANGQ